MTRSLCTSYIDKQARQVCEVRHTLPPWRAGERDVAHRPNRHGWAILLQRLVIETHAKETHVRNPKGLARDSAV